MASLSSAIRPDAPLEDITHRDGLCAGILCFTGIDVSFFTHDCADTGAEVSAARYSRHIIHVIKDAAFIKRLGLSRGLPLQIEYRLRYNSGR